MDTPVNENIKRWFLLALVCAGIFFVTITTLLIIESRFFIKNMRDLMQLKEQYADYTLAFKRMIANQDEQHEVAGEAKKKKIINSVPLHATPEHEFVAVNRDFDYLRQAALRYARARRLEGVVAPLYASKLYVPQYKKLVRKKVRHRGAWTEQKHVLVVDNNIAALRSEYPFVCPLKLGSFRFTSRFGPRKRSNGAWGFHYGLDMAAPRGTPVKAATAGVIIEARFVRGFGNMVLISHSNKLKTRYAHLSKIDVKVGDSVEQGERIGRVGNTGYTRGRNGMHLHFEVLVYGNPIDPKYFLR